MDTKKLYPPFFEQLLQQLRVQHFAIGIDHYLRLQRLLEHIDGNCSAQSLRTMLCPLFATSHKQQQQFYRVFDQLYPWFCENTSGSSGRDGDNLHTVDSNNAPIARLEKLTPILAVVCIVALFVVYAKEKSTEQQNTIDQTPVIADAHWDRSSSSSPANHNVTESVIEPNNTKVPFPRPVLSIVPDMLSVDIAQSKNLELVRAQGSGVGVDPNSVIWTSYDPAIASVSPFGRITGVSGGVTMVVARWGDSSAATLVTVNKPPAWSVSFVPILHVTLLIFPLILLLIVESKKCKKRYLSLQRARCRKPPAVWPIKAEETTLRFSAVDGFADAVRRLRERRVGSLLRFDIDATIEATVTAYGYTQLRYQSDRLQPEYIVLIERVAFRDHRAVFFQRLARALVYHGVNISEFYYDNDARICIDVETGNNVLLAELYRKLPHHRLLVFGVADQMLDPVSGQVSDWVREFMVWEDRAILTPCAMNDWGLREITLATHFVVLPASFDGVNAIVDCFSMETLPESGSWRHSCSEVSVPVLCSGQLTSTLTAYLGENGFRWLCACAVYPQLHWDLTIMLGKLPALGEETFNEKNLLRLLSLTWFQQGVMPDSVRLELLDGIETTVKRAVHIAIICMLESNPPPKETIAADLQQMYVLANRLHLHWEDRLKRKQLLKQAAMLPANMIEHDYVLVKLLEKNAVNNTLLLLPGKLRRVLLRGRAAKTAVSLMVRTVTALLLIMLVHYSFSAVYSYIDQQSIRHDDIQYRHQVLYLAALQARNHRLQRIVNKQHQDLAIIRSSFTSGQLINQRPQLVLTMSQMLDDLASFVTTDLPFRHVTRLQHIDALRFTLRDPSISVTEKIQAFIALYEQELEYGKTVEVYLDLLSVDGKLTSVELLRVGRLFLAYQSVDGVHVGYWNRKTSRYQRLPQQYHVLFDKAKKISSGDEPSRFLDVIVQLSPRSSQ